MTVSYGNARYRQGVRQYFLTICGYLLIVREAIEDIKY